MNTVWIIEAKVIYSNEWKPVYYFGISKPGIFVTRDTARRYAKKFKKENQYNHSDKTYVNYRVRKYVDSGVRT